MLTQLYNICRINHVTHLPRYPRLLRLRTKDGESDLCFRLPHPSLPLLHFRGLGSLPALDDGIGWDGAKLTSNQQTETKLEYAKIHTHTHKNKPQIHSNILCICTSILHILPYTYILQALHTTDSSPQTYIHHTDVVGCCYALVNVHVHVYVYVDIAMDLLV